jgi:hypothetical protein
MSIVTTTILEKAVLRDCGIVCKLSEIVSFVLCRIIWMFTLYAKSFEVVFATRTINHSRCNNIYKLSSRISHRIRKLCIHYLVDTLSSCKTMVIKKECYIYIKQSILLISNCKAINSVFPKDTVFKVFHQCLLFEIEHSDDKIWSICWLLAR